MRSKQREFNLRKLLHCVLEKHNLREKISQVDPIIIWKDFVGFKFYSHVTKFQLKQNILIITLDSALIKSELQKSKSSQLKHLNSLLLDRNISDIHFQSF